MNNDTHTAVGSAAPSAVAGLAVVLASTAISGIVLGPRWLGFVIVTVAVVAMTGILLRSLRLPAPLVALGELVALAGLVTAVFTRSGVLVVIPGPDAWRDLHIVLSGAAEQIRIGVPPVPETTELLCLMVIAIGAVAVAVDLLAIGMSAPAASGLVLLCVLAVPASVSGEMLPWWSFVLGVSGFAALLTVDGQRRHLVWGEPAGPGAHVGAAPSATAVGAGALVLALLSGAALTGIGTEGRLPGTGPGGGDGPTGIGLNPFTSLRGQLQSGNVVDLFRVHGVEQRAYLRALTLSRFNNAQGWEQGPLDGSIAANGPLPLPTGMSEQVPGIQVQARIEPIEYEDNWLPGFGVPLGFDGLPGDWRYDPDALTAFSDRRQQADEYRQLALIPQPDPALLRAAGRLGDPVPGVDPRYLATGEVDQRVVDLTARITESAPTAFDAAVQLNRYFTDAGNGFVYSLRTTPGSSGDALVDFLFEGKTGYCEQYASSMAIMLRTLGIPARVAVGFTPGVTTGDSRLITTEDAHAWVEAFFPGAGWIPFDPTPLADGRSVVPPYIATAPDPDAEPGGPIEEQIPAPAGQPAPNDDAALAGGGGTGGDQGPGTGTWVGLGLLAAVVLLFVGAGTPFALRSHLRGRRLRVIGAGGPPAAAAAWEEVLAESTDRGVDPSGTDTVRAIARKLARAHDLDEPGRTGLRALVSAVERAWYSTANAADPALGADRLSAALHTVRDSLARCAPPRRTARLFPRSVLPRRR